MRTSLLAAANVRLARNIVKLDTVVKLVSDTAGWSSGALGFSSTARYTYSSGFLPGGGFKSALPGVDLSKLRKFSALFTMYVNTPSGCLGYNLFRITLSNSTTVYVGVADQNADGAQAVHLYDGSMTATRPAGNVIDRLLSYTVPDGLTITKVEVCSAAYSQYPRADHGFKDVTLTMSE